MVGTPIDTVILTRADLRRYLRIDAIIESGDFSGIYEVWRNSGMPTSANPNRTRDSSKIFDIPVRTLEQVEELRAKIASIEASAQTDR